jgi:hypothetical protein
MFFLEIRQVVTFSHDLGSSLPSNSLKTLATDALRTDEETKCVARFFLGALAVVPNTAQQFSGD